MRAPYRVVILGGGFAGVRVARKLAKAAKRQHLAITLISRSGSHIYAPSLYALAGAASDTARRRELERSTSLPLRRIFAGLPVSLVEAEITGIDTEAKRVDLDDGRHIAFDTLVIAIGSEAAHFGIPGLQEHAITLKTLDDAVAVSRKIGALMRGRDKPLRITVGGAGATGVELSAMLAEKLAAYQAGAHVTLIEAQPTILSAFEPKVQKYVTEQLTMRGVMIRTGTCLTSATAQSVTLEGTADLPHDVLIWTGGIQAPAILSSLPFILEHGRLATDAPLTCAQSDGGIVSNIYALGDAASFHFAGKSAPWTVHVALQQADSVVENIIRSLEHRKLKPFKLSKQPFLLPLGTTGGIAKIYFMHFYGRISQWFVWLIETYYLMSILRFHDAMRLSLKRMRN